ncbi:NAD-dependent epimerase/dehydratase family protein [Priestia flexa]|uniref:NAD-dependent epimerase/dehydratase family protein n=1 Tax=Priestia flexa TaxID=86664 RepID=UPI0024930179|nr:NAD-dependent epimerase/dehydratase family protein [Priestia flexa]
MDSKAMRKRILITGASGFTGKHAVVHFMKKDYEVTAAMRKEMSCEGASVVSCDLENEDQVMKLIEDANPHYILHLAGQNHVGSSWEQPLSYVNSNVIGTLHLLEAVRKKVPTARIVVAGSALQYNPSDSSTLTHPYSFSKTMQILVSEAWAKLYNLDVVIAKPSNLIGPGHSNGVCSIFAKKIAAMEKGDEKKELHISNLEARRNFIDVRDAVAAYEHLFLFGQRKAVYEIASSACYSLKEVASMLRTLAHVDFQITNDEANSEPFLIPDTSPLQLIGWKPNYSLEKSLLDILTFHRQTKD